MYNNSFSQFKLYQSSKDTNIAFTKAVFEFSFAVNIQLHVILKAFHTLLHHKMIVSYKN